VFEALGGADTLDGGAGDDILDGGTGADGMTGGTGDDSYYIDDALDVVTEGVAAGTDEVLTTMASFTLAPELENLTGLVDTGQELNGNAAVNVIRAGSGTDTLAGGDSDDTLDGGGGADVMTGGYGSDTFYVDHVDDSLIEAGSGGDDDLAIASVSFRLAYGVNHLQLVGTAGTGLGNSLSNDISGNASANVLKGLNGNDTIVGGAGADRIYGGPGSDLLQGDAGADRFYFDASFTSSANVDRIGDFSIQDDSIFLSRSFFKTMAAGPLTAAAFHTGASAHDRSDRIVYDPATGNLFYDPDGTGATAQVLFATLEPALRITNADFVVYG
jgi:Ca2+-binding RTX toxin-like protein